ncbi:MAG: 30S ribosomal protein S27e [Candidatus Nitrosothermus koennekii]|nr:MAG: 30S ribosomal protein S27e [Candidatus Nitrosothermus koennekii]
MPMKIALIPKPASQFLLVKCSKCGEETIIYSHTTTNRNCKSCNELLAESTGGKARIYGEIVKRLDNP